MMGFAEKREFSGLKFSLSGGKKPIGEKIGENQKKTVRSRQLYLQRRAQYGKILHKAGDGVETRMKLKPAGGIYIEREDLLHGGAAL